MVRIGTVSAWGLFLGAVLAPALAGCDTTKRPAPQREGETNVAASASATGPASSPVEPVAFDNQKLAGGERQLQFQLQALSDRSSRAAGIGDGIGRLGGVRGSPSPAAMAPGNAAKSYDHTSVTLPALDPNARYATTYRPGGAALAAFDAALGRGQIPAAYRDIVGDFGARYAPPLDPPASGALAIAVHTARGAVGPGGGPMNLAVVL